MIRSTIRRWRAVASVGAPALVVLAACGGGGPSVDAGSDGGDMAELMFDADWALDGTAEGLLGAGYEFGRLTAHFAACDEASYRYVYRTSLRAPDGAAFSPADVAALRADLADAGWEGVDAADDAPDAAAALTMETECAAATEREIELFEAMGEWEPVRRLPDPSAPPTTG